LGFPHLLSKKRALKTKGLFAKIDICEIICRACVVIMKSQLLDDGLWAFCQNISLKVLTFKWQPAEANRNSDMKRK